MEHGGQPILDVCSRLLKRPSNGKYHLTILLVGRKY